MHLDGETVAYDEPVMEIETADQAMRDWIPPAAVAAEIRVRQPAAAADPCGREGESAVILGLGGYLPREVVTNAELVRDFPAISEEYVYQVTGIRQRHWAADDEKPSDMAYAASLEAIRKSGIATKDIDAIIVATTTPDVAMPSTACILQDRLSLGVIPAFDLNAACSGWLYAVSMARGMIISKMARNVLAVGVDMQSRLLDRSDREHLLPLRRRGRGGDRFRRHQRPPHPPGDPRLRHPRPAHGPPRRAGLPRAQRPARRPLDPASTATPCSASPPRASPT